MARAHIEFKAYIKPPKPVKQWCPPTTEAEAYNNFAECLICDGVFVARVSNGQYIYNYGAEEYSRPKLRWQRISCEDSDAWRLYKQTKRHMKKEARKAKRANR
jgi:hypothetical protein